MATNASDNRVLRYGMTRANVIGIEAVLANGEVSTDLRGLPNDNAGFDLRASSSEARDSWVSSRG